MSKGTRINALLFLLTLMGCGTGAGTPDGGTPDGGAPDGGAPDGGAPDGGAPDGGAPDGGAADGGYTGPYADLPSATLVSEAIEMMDSPNAIHETEVTTLDSGLQIARTRMEIAFMPDATVGQMRELLVEIDGSIISSIEGVAATVVRIPDPGSLEELDVMIADIEDKPYVWFVSREHLAATRALPGIYGDPLDVTKLPRIDHHLAVRAHAAWNAVAATSAVPQVLVVDAFGDGPPTKTTIDYQTAAPLEVAPSPLHYHGYHILGIMSGTFGGSYVTGIFPNKIRLATVDIVAHPGLIAALNKVIQVLQGTAGNVVVNMSVGSDCARGGSTCLPVAVMRREAALWIDKVRSAGLENRVLFVTAAGNIVPAAPGVRDAATSFVANSAALLHGIVDAGGNPVSNLSNTLVIENAMHEDNEPFTPSCLFRESFVGGHLSAIGTDVYSHANAAGTLATEDTGTSMAAAQVTGLIAYLWSIEPSLTIAQIRTILVSSARPLPTVGGGDCSDYPTPAPIVDAYHAVLSVDAAAGPTPAGSPVRHAIMDVTGDGAFDEDDLEQFVEAYYQGRLPPAPPYSGFPDYSMFDLNGDGASGGEGRAPFDLDRVGSVQHGPSTYQVDTAAVFQGTSETLARSYDENAMTDSGILCYYAYSDLYTGNLDRREQILPPSRCAVGWSLLLGDGKPNNGNTSSVVVALTHETNADNYARDPGGGLPDFSSPSCGEVAGGFHVLPGTSQAYMAQDSYSGVFGESSPQAEVTFHVSDDSTLFGVDVSLWAAGNYAAAHAGSTPFDDAAYAVLAIQNDTGRPFEVELDWSLTGTIVPASPPSRTHALLGLGSGLWIINDFGCVPGERLIGTADSLRQDYDSDRDPDPSPLSSSGSRTMTIPADVEVLRVYFGGIANCDADDAGRCSVAASGNVTYRIIQQ